MDTYVHERDKMIARQQQAIRELSTPILCLRERLLLLPIVGVLDTERSRQLGVNLLSEVRARRARVVIIDITGVPAVDTKVAQHLLRTVAAVKLMGAGVIVSGISSEVAQAIVALGIDLAPLNPVGDLQTAVEDAEHMLGLRVVREAAQ